jgi:hypothetical protein
MYKNYCTLEFFKIKIIKTVDYLVFVFLICRFDIIKVTLPNSNVHNVVEHPDFLKKSAI